MERVKLYEVVERDVVTADPHRLTFGEMSALGSLIESANWVQGEDTLVYPVSRKYTVPVDRIVSRVVRGENNVICHDQLVAVHPDVLQVVTVLQQDKITSLQAEVIQVIQDNTRLREKLGKYPDEVRENFASLSIFKRILMAIAPANYTHLLK